MNRAQFLALAGQLYDAFMAGSGASLGAGPAAAPSHSGGGGAPKFDTSIARKGGLVQWASETDLDGLVFWKARADEPPTDEKYREKNAKQSKSLSYWITYRQANPDAIWTGERNRQKVTAAPPSNRPMTYQRAPLPDVPTDNYFGSGSASAPAGDAADAYSDADLDDIPF